MDKYVYLIHDGAAVYYVGHSAALIQRVKKSRAQVSLDRVRRMSGVSAPLQIAVVPVSSSESARMLERGLIRLLGWAGHPLSNKTFNQAGRHKRDQVLMKA